MHTPSNFILEDWYRFLHNVSIFSELEDTSFKEVAKMLKPLSLPKGTTLFREGEPGDALYILRSGRLRVVKEQADGQEKFLNYLGRGDTIGETTLLTGTPRTVTIKVDSHANLLVLYRKDFEEFLKNNPAASFYFSRFLSKRLWAATESHLHAKRPSELLGFYCDLEKPDHIVYVINQCIALTEQTRRKVLLLELGPYGEDLIKSVGLDFHRLPKHIKSQDLHHHKFLEKITHTHPSGLEMIALSEETFLNHNVNIIAGLLSTLRENYDYVVIDIHGLRDSSLEKENASGMVEAFLNECDTVFYVRRRMAQNREFLDSLVFDKGEIKEIILDDQVQTAGSPGFIVPWKDSTTTSYLNGNRPYLNGRESEGALKAVQRISRFIGKLQVGLAMGSGAAYGYSIIGILKVLEREKIPIDFVSGTSMGALLGALYSCGRTAEEVEEIAAVVTKLWLRRNFFSDLNLPWPHGGLLMGHTVSKFLRVYLGEKEFKDMVIPFACAATDIISGDAVVLREGKVWEAVRASLSLPFIFRPYVLGNQHLVDGGLLNPVPSSILASMGADILISINLTSKASEKKVASRLLGMFPSSTPGIFNILFKMFYTMQYQIAAAKNDLSHINIRPDTRNFSWFDFHKSKQIIPSGVEAAEESLSKIKSLLPYFSDYCRVSLRLPK